MGVSKRTVERVDGAKAVADFDTSAERETRRIGRPSKAEPFRSFLVVELVAQLDVLAVGGGTGTALIRRRFSRRVAVDARGTRGGPERG